MFLVERRISLFWTAPGLIRKSTSLPSLPGPGSENLRSSTTGSGEWPINIIVRRNSFLVGPFTDRAPVGTLRPPMNFLTWLSHGLEIQIPDSEPLGRRAKDWRNSSRIGEPCWFLTAWSRSKIRLVHKKGGSVSLPSKRFCANLLPSIGG